MKSTIVEKPQTRDFASEIINKKREISKESKVPHQINVCLHILQTRSKLEAHSPHRHQRGDHAPEQEFWAPMTI